MLRRFSVKNLILYLIVTVALSMGCFMVIGRTISFAASDLDVSAAKTGMEYNQTTDEYEYTYEYTGVALDITSLIEISYAGSEITDNITRTKFQSDKSTLYTDDIINVGVYYVNVIRQADNQYNTVNVWVRVEIITQKLTIDNVKVYESVDGEEIVLSQSGNKLSGTAQSRDYNGNTQLIYAEIKDNQNNNLVVGYLYTKETESGNTVVSEIKDAGKYTIRINVSNNNNYYIADIDITLEILPIEVLSYKVYESVGGDEINISDKIGTATNREYKLDNSKHEIYSELFGLNGEQLTPKYIYYLANDLTNPITEIVNAGNYKIVITNDTNSNSNYKMDIPIQVFITIDKYSSSHYSEENVKLNDYTLYVGQPISAITDKISGIVYTTNDALKEEIEGVWSWKNPNEVLTDENKSSQEVIFTPNNANFESYETIINDIIAQYLKVKFGYTKSTGGYYETAGQNIYYNTSVNDQVNNITVPSDYIIKLGKQFTWSIDLNKNLTEQDVNNTGFIFFEETYVDIIYSIVYIDSVNDSVLDNEDFIREATLTNSAELKTTTKPGYDFKDWAYLISGNYQSITNNVVSIDYCLKQGIIDNSNTTIYIYAIWKLQAPKSVEFENLKTEIIYNGQNGGIKLIANANVESEVENSVIKFLFIKKDTNKIVQDFSDKNTITLFNVIDSGTYIVQAKIVVGGNDESDCVQNEITIKINPATPSTSETISNISEYYSGYERVSNINLIGVEGELLQTSTVYYTSEKENGKYIRKDLLDVNPINVGDYIAVVKTDDLNYQDIEFEQLIHIYKREIYVSTESNKNVFYNTEEDELNNIPLELDTENSLFLSNKTYTGNSQEIYSNVSYNNIDIDIEFIYCSDEGFDRSDADTWIIVNELKDAGTYYVIAKSSNSNFGLSFKIGEKPLPVVIKVEIAKADMKTTDFGDVNGPKLEDNTVLYAGQEIGDLLNKIVANPIFNGKSVTGEFHWVKKLSDGSYKIDDRTYKTSEDLNFKKLLMFYVSGDDEKNINNTLFELSVPVEMLTVTFKFKNIDDKQVTLIKDVQYEENAIPPEEFDEYYHDLNYARENCYNLPVGKRLVWEGGSYENVTAHQVLIANFIDIVYTIKYHSNHSAFEEPQIKSMLYQDIHILPPANAITGYSFGGWQCDGDNLTGERQEISQINVAEFVAKNRIDIDNTINIYARYYLNAPEVSLIAENNKTNCSYGDKITLSINISNITPSDGDVIQYSYEWYKGTYSDNHKLDIAKSITSLNFEQVEDSGIYFVKVMASDKSQNSNITISQALVISITPKAVEVIFEGIREDFKDGDKAIIKAYYINNAGEKVYCNISGLPQNTLQRGNYKLIANISDSNYVAKDETNVISFSIKGGENKLDSIMIMLIIFIVVACVGLIATVIITISFKKGRLSLIDAKKEAQEHDKLMQEMVKDLPEEISEDQLVALKNQERENDMLRNLGLLKDESTNKKRKNKNPKVNKDKVENNNGDENGI